MRSLRFLGVSLLLSICSVAAFAAAEIPSWVTDAAAEPPGTYDPEISAVCLLDETAVAYTSNGDVRTRRRVVYRILGTEGRELGVARAAFGKDSKLLSLRAWSIPKNGEPYAVKERDAIETSLVDFELYSDRKLRLLQIPAADPGAVIAWEAEHLNKVYALQDSWHFQREIPVVRARYALRYPGAWKHNVVWMNAAPVTPTTGPDGVTWEVTSLAEVKSEVGRPAARAVAGWMGINLDPPAAVSTPSLRSWSDVGAWYADLTSGRAEPDDAIRSKTADLTTGGDVRAKIAALSGFAQRDIRYVAVAIGIGGFQPHAATQIFRGRYGDCKDKVTLLASMLKTIGVDVHYVLVNTDRGAVRADFPGYDSFDHAIAAIKLPKEVDASKFQAVVSHPKHGKLLLFDPTNTVVPFGELPDYLQDSDGLLVAGDGGDLIRLPLAPPEAARLTVDAKATLDVSGALSVEVSEKRTGWLAAKYRQWLSERSTTERQRMVEERAGYSFSNFTLSDLKFENVEAIDRDLVVSYKVTATGYARRAGAMFLVRPRLMGRKAEGLITLDKRKYAYELDAPSVHTDNFTIQFPAALAVDELPPAQDLALPQLRYKSATKVEGETLHYTREYRVEKIDVPFEQLKELNAVFSKILADERNTAVLLPR
jgi:hypothetical protein